MKILDIVHYHGNKPIIHDLSGSWAAPLKNCLGIVS
jgi:hypothetical protein